MPLVEIRNLTVRFGSLTAVDGIDLVLQEGDVLGVVGESGSGKSVTSLALLGLIGFPGVVTADRMTFAGRDLLDVSPRERRRIVGKDMAMIFQEPSTSLNPCFTVGFQIMEQLRVHERLDRRARRARAIELLELVGIPDPAARLSAFPHQLSGGMNQRVMIAMAISCNPRLLIADEPTTALDVTIQAQILDLLLMLQRERGMTMILITHDMGVVAETARRVAVMYAGQIMEERAAVDLFARPSHPYTAALLEALPERAIGKDRLPAIPGTVPGAFDRPDGCLFAPRCRFAEPACRAAVPHLVDRGDVRVRCIHPLNIAPESLRT